MRRRLGAEGERRAASFLTRRGYRILERNVRWDGVELDLIVRRGGLVAFVEVKTRRSLRQGAPELAVDAGKQARLIRGASAWLVANPGRSQRIRFDVVSCLLLDSHRHPGSDRERWRLRHFENAFRPGE